MVGLMTPPEVVTLGEALVAVRPTDATPALHAATFTLAATGAEANVVLALSRLGHRTAFLGRVGDDTAGRRIRRTLQADGVDTSGLRTDASAPTALLLRDVAGQRPTTVDYHRSGSAGARLEPDDVEVSLIAGARFLHVTGLTCGLSATAARAVEHAVALAAAAGTAVSLDPNLRARLHPPETWRRLVAPLLAHVGLVIGSSDELCVVTGSADTPQAIDRLLSAGVGTVVIRGGTAPTRVVTPDEQVQVEVRPVEPVDPVGAGDAFAGGLLSGLLDELDLPAVVARAHAVARRCVQVAGDTEGLPTRGELAREDGEVVR